MSKELNEIAVRELRQSLKQAQTVIIVDYQGVDACSLDALRQLLRQGGASYQIVKNSLAHFAVREIGMATFDELLVGSTAFAFTDEDPGRLAKMLSHFAGEQNQFAIKGGVFQDEVLKREEIELWATLPERSEVLSLLVISLKAPQVALAMTLGGIIRKLIRVVELVKEKTKTEDKEST